MDAHNDASEGAGNGTRKPHAVLTALGSPCSPVWSDAHIALVNAAESGLGKRICGARTCAGNPCALPPNHENGRCQYHGGLDLTGAQPGNRNAVIHGLYSRGVQTCGEHCPMWKSCPCACEEVKQLPENDRPKCPYEAAQYSTSLTDALARVSAHRQADAQHRQVAHQVAVLEVMQTRCAAAVGVNPIVEVTEVESAKGKKREQKLSVYVQAYLRITGELRRFQAQLTPKEPHPQGKAERYEYARRAEVDASLLPEDRAAADEAISGKARAAQAMLHAAKVNEERHDEAGAIESVRRATELEPGFVAAVFDPQDPLFERGLWWLSSYARPG